MIIVVLVALTSAALFAVGSSLQHRSAGSAPKDSKRQMLLTLLRRPGWLAGAALCAAAFALHAVALSLGDLSLVQPIILSGIAFAVFARSAIDRQLPSRAEMGWAIVAWAGLALFIAVLRPSAPQPADNGRALVTVGVGLSIVIGLGLFARRSGRHPLLRGVLLAAASGVLFGLVAGLLKLCTGLLGDGLAQLLTSWAPWTLLGVGAGAVLLNQRAYQSTRLSVTTPVLNICQLAVSVTFGLLVFAERLFASPLTVVAEVTGLAIMVFAVCMLAARSAAQPGTEPESRQRSERPSAAAPSGRADQDRGSAGG